MLLFERTFERYGHPGQRYSVRVLDRIDGLELHVTSVDAAAAPMVFKLTGDEARDVAGALERAASRIYPRCSPEEEH